jgi:hypothetical protein
MNRTSLKQLLSSVSYFAELDAATMAAVCRVAVRREFAAGQVVFLEWEPCAGLHIVEAGYLKSLKMSPAGREQTLRMVGPGEVFNDLTVFSGSPNVVTVIALEAMAAGKPIVASNVAGLPYAIRDGENGILVEEKNPREIVRGIIALAGDAELRARYGERGRTRVRELLNWENVAREFVAVYKSAIERG